MKTLSVILIIAGLVSVMILLGVLISKPGKKLQPILSHGTLGKETISYLNILYPLREQYQWSSLSDAQLADIYTNLQVLYTPIIGQYWDQITKRIPQRSTQESKNVYKPYSIENLNTKQLIMNADGTTKEIPGEFSQRLFDGSVCDCLRAWVPACSNAPRFSASLQYEANCPQWPGLATVTDIDNMLDLLSIGGYPDNSFVEILTFPGEYGVPENCPLNNQSIKDIPNQPVTFPGHTDWELTGVPQTSGGGGPYFDNQSYPPCGPGSANSDIAYGADCPTSKFPYCYNCKCMQANVNGTGTGLCMDPSIVTPDWRTQYEQVHNKVAAPVCTSGNCQKYGKDYNSHEGFDIEPYYKHYGHGHTQGITVPANMFVADHIQQQKCKPTGCGTCTTECSTDAPCPCPTIVISPLFYYPLRGLGIWTNLSKAAACATKMGFVTTPKAGMTTTGLGGITIPNVKLSGGGGYTIKDLIGNFVGSIQGNLGIKAQVSTVYQWLYDGELTSTTSKQSGNPCKKSIQAYGQGNPPGWEYVAKNILKYSSPNVKGNSNNCMEGAFALVTAWYQEGFIRHGKDTTTFNSDAGNWWPCGALFTYSSAIDITVTGVMQDHQYDSLQQICEPQHSQGSMRPANVTEIIKAIQKKGAPVKWISTNSTDRSGCDTNYLVNPMDDFDTWQKHGYVNASKTNKSSGGSGVISFDHRIMPLTPSNAYKNALTNKS